MGWIWGLESFSLLWRLGFVRQGGDVEGRVHIHKPEVR